LGWDGVGILAFFIYIYIRGILPLQYLPDSCVNIFMVMTEKGL